MTTESTTAVTGAPPVRSSAWFDFRAGNRPQKISENSSCYAQAVAYSVGMKSNYTKAFEALKTVKSSDYNLSTTSGFQAMWRAMWMAICAAGIKVTKNQALRAFTGPRDGYWTTMDMAEYLARRCK